MQEKERMQPLVDVLKVVRQRGYTSDFMVTDDGSFRETASQKAYLPDQVKIVDFYRFEHDTNPGDMAILYVVETSDGLKGTISDAYGAYSDAKTENFMRQVEDLGKNVDRHN